MANESLQKLVSRNAVRAREMKRSLSPNSYKEMREEIHLSLKEKEEALRQQLCINCDTPMDTKTTADYNEYCCAGCNFSYKKYLVKQKTIRPVQPAMKHIDHKA